MPTPIFLATADDLRPVLAELQPREPIFHRADFYKSPQDFDHLMAPGYWEVGASGRRYSRAFILQHLAANTPVDAEVAGWTTTDFACTPLSPQTCLLTYTLNQSGRLTRRATIWHRTETDWQILYHQGTVMTGEQDDTTPGNQDYLPRRP